jgi:hypothetical protein
VQMASKSKSTEVELHPDAWERFERAVDTVAKAPPQHRAKGSAKKKKTRREKKFKDKS